MYWTRFFFITSASMLALTAVATVSMVAGNPTAVNAVVAAGFMSVFSGVLAYVVYRRERDYR